MRAAVWEARSKAPAVALAWPPAPQTSAFLDSGDARDPRGRGRAAEGDGTALRITAEETDDGVELQIDDATEPEEGDEVVERDGARVFLDSVAAEVLADQVLGVDAHGDHFHFTFDDQSA